MTGLFVPVVGLVGAWLGQAAARSLRRANLLLTATLVLALPTNLVVLLAAFSGIQTHNAAIYLTRGESQTLTWIDAYTPPHALVLASPDMGLWIPAHTGRQVVYGHPFETVDAAQEKAAVEAFFSGNLADPAGFLSQHGVDYIFYGPREQKLGSLPEIPGLQPVYQADGVVLYALAGD
jgi:hypothetical protein